MRRNLEINYSDWKREYQSILESLSDKKVMLLFSGGKDSSLAMHLISKARKEFGFDFEAHAGSYPVHRYTDAEKKRIESYWKRNGSNIVWHDLGVTDDYIKDAVNPCHPCQELRKKSMKTVFTSTIQDWESVVLIACFNLWDIVSYSLEHLLGNIFCDSDMRMGSESNRRIMETAQRFYPVLKMKEGYIVFRPLIKYNANDIRKVISEKGIPILSISCKFCGFRPKSILQGYYERMGIRFDYDQVFEFAKKSLNLPNMTLYTSIVKEEYLARVF